MEDNARKFTLSGIDADFFDKNKAVSFTLVVDWLDTGDENERKLAYKRFDDGKVQILLISKVTRDGKRTSEKKEIEGTEYKKLLASSSLHLEKKRYEFDFAQNGLSFNCKYDEFADGKLCILEVDAKDEAARSLFNAGDFPYPLSEVTGNMKYYGYRVAKMV